ncbi:lipase family protein [Saccharophagus degradans]|uniref:lipase family protein n=1 Tax=Saccharophagus degradans TaxID=86304 RepID=UPI001C080E40|nr:lipase family protein [Saccharophagus degradans]MBU2986085.1 lipase family protein [Saccharophagus degradans]
MSEHSIIKKLQDAFTTIKNNLHLLGQPEDVSKAIAFSNLDWYAKRAQAAYQSEADIRAAFPNTTMVKLLPEQDIQFFVETFPEQKQQVITVRGTANKLNAIEDAEYVQASDTRLGIYVHSGFLHSTNAVYAALTPHLISGFTLKLTGHSLGAAISTLLMMYLEKDGYRLAPSVNFGQPKVTNKAGADAYNFLPLLRVVDKNDIVPLIPVNTLLASIHGDYEHFGEEVILLDGEYFVYLDRHGVQHVITQSFIDNLDDLSLNDHRIANYCAHIESKLAGAIQVPFKEREKYIKQATPATA